MFSVHGQENVIHGHQQLAASKPLNHGVKGLAPKTPGNKYPKTPVRLPLRDENDQISLKGKGVLTAKAKVVDNAFITPMSK
jgi:hypothetical protein